MGIEGRRLKTNATEYSQAIQHQFNFLRYGSDVSHALLRRLRSTPAASISPFMEPSEIPQPSYPMCETPNFDAPFMQFLEAAQTGGMISLTASPGMRADGIRRLLALTPTRQHDPFEELFHELGIGTEGEEMIHDPSQEALLFAYAHASLAVGFLRNYTEITQDINGADPKDEAARAFIRSMRGQLGQIQLFTPHDRYLTYEYWRRGTATSDGSTAAEWIAKFAEVKGIIHKALYTTEPVNAARVIDAANFFAVLEGLYCILYLDRALGKGDARYPRM